MTRRFKTPHEALRYHASGAIARGERQPITEQTKRYPRCDSCEALMINGVYCHETGCPNTKKTWVPEREAWVRFIPCFECGGDIEEGESCDCLQPDSETEE